MYLKPTKSLQQSRRLKRANIQKRDWAHVIDVNTPLTNFHELVPEMAHKVQPFLSFPFKSTTYTKNSILLSWTRSRSKQFIT